MVPVPIFVLMGTAGCGKSSVAEAMQHVLGCEFLEGDSVHPQANVDKMAAGYPLDDDDRWPWLRLIRTHLTEKAKAVQDLDIACKNRAVLVTCSSLKKVYRDILREIPADIAQVIFVYLKGSEALLLQRIQGRKNHFMPPSMLQSQLSILEEPNPEEEAVIIADIIPTPDVEAKHIIAAAVEKGYLPDSIPL
ncbi:shikimate kinase [Mucor mucedo]|uniref:shikimate kinase n=1 Tax=Mucor mucedo TaxID=29922 RepID=UPI002220B899|nr:shikimate kinase [Mucor mucedo]KAI7896701.1 shikimate kinase [Mucor mucedo]